jgi:Cu/Ag efflux pump CusA
MSILILVMGMLSIFRTPTDIFPNINIPVVSIIWIFDGMVARDMSDRIVSVTERSLTTTVDNIEHIESQSLFGIAVVKVFIQPNASLDRAIAQITAVSQTQLRQLAPGSTPPLILAYSASTAPVLQLALSGQGLSEQQLNDYGLNFIRTQLITVPGASVPYPYGGKQRQVQVDLNPSALQAHTTSTFPMPLRKQWKSSTASRSLGPRWVPSTDQHRPCGRSTLGPADHPESRRCLHAKRDFGRQGPSAADRYHGTAAIENGASC